MREVTLRLYDEPTVRRFADALQEKRTVNLNCTTYEPLSYKVLPRCVAFTCRLVGKVQDTAAATAYRWERTTIYQR